MATKITLPGIYMTLEFAEFRSSYNDIGIYSLITQREYGFSQSNYIVLNYSKTKQFVALRH